MVFEAQADHASKGPIGAVINTAASAAPPTRSHLAR